MTSARLALGRGGTGQGLPVAPAANSLRRAQGCRARGAGRRPARVAPVVPPVVMVVERCVRRLADGTRCRAGCVHGEPAPTRMLLGEQGARPTSLYRLRASAVSTWLGLVQGDAV